MQEQKRNRDKLVQARLTQAEFDAIQKQFSRTTNRKLSEFIRKQLLSKPHIGKVRNESLDDFATELSRLRMELNGIGNNFNQAVKKLHTLNSKSEIDHWLVSWELDKRSFQKCVQSVADHMDKVNDQWLQ